MKLFPKTDYQFLVDKYFRKELFYVHCMKNEVFQYGFLKSIWQNQQFPADLVTFTEEICNRKTSFFCTVVGPWMHLCYSRSMSSTFIHKSICNSHQILSLSVNFFHLSNVIKRYHVSLNSFEIHNDVWKISCQVMWHCRLCRKTKISDCLFFYQSWQRQL